jgi:4-hydroxybenzoate polyprenyltransferase
VDKKTSGLIELMRPKQWIKNFFVFAALIFSKKFIYLPYLIKTLHAFICFCLISSSVYILNDIVDEKKDKLHPKKKTRPIAAGVVEKKEAIIFLIILIPITLIFSIYVDVYFFMILSFYLINNILYTFKLKHMVIIDVMSIAAGFIFRVVGGALAIGVIVSPWILVCTMLLSMFLALSKRRNELIILDNNAGNHREILKEYSLPFIDNMLSTITASIVMAYSLYTFFAYTEKYMMLTIPFVLYGIFRYQYIVYKENKGGSPDEIVITDIPLLINIILWVIISILILMFT